MVTSSNFQKTRPYPHHHSLTLWKPWPINLKPVKWIEWAIKLESVQEKREVIFYFFLLHICRLLVPWILQNKPSRNSWVWLHLVSVIWKILYPAIKEASLVRDCLPDPPTPTRRALPHGVRIIREIWYEKTVWIAHVAHRTVRKVSRFWTFGSALSDVKQIIIPHTGRWMFISTECHMKSWLRGQIGSSLVYRKAFCPTTWENKVYLYEMSHCIFEKHQI